jgi:hypothetical protein
VKLSPVVLGSVNEIRQGEECVAVWHQQLSTNSINARNVIKVANIAPIQKIIVLQQLDEEAGLFAAFY